MVAITTLISTLFAASAVLASSLEQPLNVAHGDRSAVVARAHAHRRHHARRAVNKRCDAKPEHSSPSSTGKPRATSTGKASTPTQSGKSNVDKGANNGGASGGESNGLPSAFRAALANAVNTWSTIPGASGSEKLSDTSLNVFRGKQTKHAFTTDVSGLSRNTETVLRAFYQKGSTSPGHSGGLTPGFSLYSKTTSDLTKGDEVYFSYKAYFPKDFDFVHGGKMPGLYAGSNDDIATKCSGGNQPAGCFSIRMMWRDDGEGELYSYLPRTTANVNAYKAKVTKVHENGKYGISVGRGSFHWARGAWTEVTQRVKLNSVSGGKGKNDGELQVWVNGKEIMHVTNLMYRTDTKTKVRGAQIETFFGGHDSYWKTPKDQYAYFKDFSTAVLK